MGVMMSMANKIYTTDEIDAILQGYQKSQEALNQYITLNDSILQIKSELDDRIAGLAKELNDLLLKQQKQGVNYAHRDKQ
jgi:cell fate (sporulation/competence/biofilm development) regulator YmcA (YheA/YmcA/DUF963 family)